MSDLERVSFTIESDLLDKVEHLMERGGFPNRSEFLRDLIRDRLVEEEWDRDTEALGTITLIYDHDRKALGNKLTKLQHAHHHAVLATTHVHLDHHLCAEMIMVRDKAHHIQALAEQLGRQKGVLHAKLAMSSTGKRLR